MNRTSLPPCLWVLRYAHPAALLVVAAILLSSAAAYAADGHAAAAADKVARFLMVLRQPGAQGNGKEVKEPDVTPLGGKVIGRHQNGVVIDLPLASLKRLRDDDNVAFVQRIWMGEPLESWAADAANEQPAAAAASRVRPLEIATNATWNSGNYAYDPSGNITAIGANSYVYDSAQRLISSTTSGVNEAYRYDSFGNLVEKTIAGQPAGTIAVDPGSNRLSGFEYDVAGNQLTDAKSRYTYDAVGMMAMSTSPQGGSPVRMIYTADDERIATIVDSSTAYWRVRDFNTAQVLREWKSDSGDAWLWNEDFIYADGHLVAGQRENLYGGKRHFTLDHLGSVRMITRDDRTQLQAKEFLPFGVERTPSNQEYTNLGYVNTRPEPMNFAGHERDFRGQWDTVNTDYLDDMHARYYNPNAGRFMAVDPLLNVKGSITTPQAWNRYSYVINNPVRYTDSNGRECGGCLAFERDNQDLLHRRITVEEFNARNNARAVGALIGAAPFIALEAYGAFNTLALNVMARIAMWGGGGAATAESLRRAADGGGPTVRVVTNLTQAPQEGRALSAATGEGAEALANAARSGDGVRTYAANIPKALVSGLQQAGLLQIRTTQMNGVTATEYRFGAGASQYIAKFFKDITDKVTR